MEKHTVDTGDLPLVNKESGVHENKVNLKTSQKEHDEETTNNRKIIKLEVVTGILIIISIIQVCVIVSAVYQKTNLTRAQQSSANAEQSCRKMSSSEALCCSKDEQNRRYLLNVLMVAHLTSDEKENNTLESSNRNTKFHDSLLHQDGYLYYPRLSKDHELLPWVVRNLSDISEVTRSRSTRFTIPKKGIYYVYVSLSFRYNTTTEISGTVYRKHHNIEKKLLFMNKTVQTNGSGNVWSYYDLEMSGLFHLYKSDELYMKTNNTVFILPHIVYNYFGILSIPDSTVV